MRLDTHPVLGAVSRGARVTIEVDGKRIEAYEGEPLAVALMAAGYWAFRHTAKTGSPRGLYCADGTCGDCRVHVGKELNVPACITPVVAGMTVRLPDGLLDVTEGGCADV